MKRNNRREGLIDFLKAMRNQEERCVSVIKPFDVLNFDPMLVKVTRNSFEGLLAEYFRLVLSSEPQKAIPHGAGRNVQWLLFDRVSSSFIGYIFVCEMAFPWGAFDRWAGAPIGWSPGQGNAGHPTGMHVYQLRRCLPTFEFGPLTGGKLMTLAATATETVSYLEMLYNFSVQIMLIKATGSHTSQYNRLTPRGIFENRALSTPDRVCYSMDLRENALSFMRQEITTPGARLTYSFADQVAYWKTRWLPNRLDRTTNGKVTVDRSRYLLSSQFDEKLELCLSGLKE